MIGAKLRVDDDDRDYGTWMFSVLPREGDVVVIRVSDEPVMLRVKAAIHVPVQSAPSPGELPRVELVVHRMSAVDDTA